MSESVHGNLPAVYASDPTAQAFATAIDSMLAPVDQTLGRLPDNFDAFMAPTELLPYLVRVSQARVEPSWPERAVRAAIDLAAWLAMHRGTPAALLREARIVYGWALTISDPGGVRLPDDALEWPADGTLRVDLEPVPSGWNPVAYNQGSLERLIAAHVPASAPRVLAPPPGKCALYDGPYSTGHALIVSRDIADLAASNFDNRTTSVWNRSQGIIAVYEDPDFGEAGGHQSVASQLAVNVTEALNNRISSVKFLTAVPTGSWGLLDVDGNLLGVYEGDASNLDAGVGASATSLVNKTIHTIRAFGARPDSSQVVYPGFTDVLEAGLTQDLSRVTVYTQVPEGAFCLYELAQQGGRQWLLWTQPGQSADLAAIGVENTVLSVYNRTAVTVELCANSERTGASQLFYPSAFADVTTAGLEGQASLVAVLNGAPAGYYCFYAGPGPTGKQWVFKYAGNVTINLTDPRIGADDVVSMVENHTDNTLELFKNDNGTGSSQLFYPDLTVAVTTQGLVGLARSVTVYDGAPAGSYCLYANSDRAGLQWVFRDTAVTAQLSSTTVGAGNAVSLVENNTTRTLALFKASSGSGDSQLFYPGITAAVTAPGLDKNTQSATVYDGAPAGSYCLYANGNKSGLQWVFRDTAETVQLTGPTVGAGNAVSLVENNMSRTLALFKSDDGTGTSDQLFYPGITSAVTAAGLDKNAQSATVYDGAPAGSYCLYANTNKRGNQWVFRGTTGTVLLTSPTIGAGDAVSLVENNSARTLALFKASDGTGDSQLFYPSISTSVTAPGLDNNARSVTVYDGAPADHYCLYGGSPLAQWIFKATPGTDQVLAAVGAANTVTQIENNSSFTIELFQNTNASGTYQLSHPKTNVPVNSDVRGKATLSRCYNGPPADYFCLYDGSNQAGAQWVFRDAPGTWWDATPADQNWNDKISSVYNRTRHTIQLFEAIGQGMRGELFYPAQSSNVTTINNLASSVACYNGCPPGYLCLFDGRNQSGNQYVLRPTIGVTSLDTVGASNKISSVRNLTDYTFTLNGPGATQYCYPSQNADVQASLDDKGTSITVYNGAPAGTYCLYANTNKTGKQWIFSDAAVTVQLTSPTIGAGNAVSLVENKTSRTLALFKASNGTGDSQLFYPANTASVTVPGLDKNAQSATVYDGAPADHYCLYGGSPLTQWVFKAVAGDQVLAAVGAGNAATKIENNSSYTIELFQNTNASGTYQLSHPKTNVPVNPDLLNRATLSRCYNGPPADYFCFYDGTDQNGAQWVFRAAPGTWWNATPADQNWNDKISSVNNRTRYTLQLFEATGQGMRGELFYPARSANVTTINNLGSSVACYDGPPNGYYCLYTGAGQAGSQYVLRSTVGNVDLHDVGCNDMISSVRNLTKFTIQLWADPGPSGVWQLCYPSQNADVQDSLDNKTSIVTVHEGPPPGYYTLYEGYATPGDPYRQWLFNESSTEVNLTQAGIGAVGISYVTNNTRYTLELFEQTNATGMSRMFYPGLTAFAEGSFNDKAKYARLYNNGPPAGFYCLYANTNKSGNQWMFREATGTVSLTNAAIGAGSAVSLVENKTSRTLALFKAGNGTGDSQFFYPGSTTSVTAPGLDKQAQSVTVYDGAPVNHYCLYGGSPLAQWIFKVVPGTDQVLSTVGAANTVTHIENNSSYTIELFQNTSASGFNQISQPKTNISVNSDLRNRATLSRCYNGPPAGYFCLYDEPNQNGAQWVFPAAPGTWWDATAANQSWNDKISSVYNQTRHTIQLFEHPGQTGRGELFYPGQRANVTIFNNLASSLACYNGCPDGYYCLYTGDNQTGDQFVLRSTVGNVDLHPVGCNDMISSVHNRTSYTIQLWADPGPSGVWQLCYPTQNTNVNENLDNKASAVTVHNGPPPGWSGYYCLYEHGETSGRQWLFHQSSTEVDLTRSGVGAVGISNVRNNTWYTLELFEQSNATGQSQMFYPGLATVAESWFNDKAKYARLHIISAANRNSLRSGYYCLFEHGDYSGLQWLFRAPSKVNLTNINASDRVSSVANHGPREVWLYTTDNWGGSVWKVPVNAWQSALSGWNDKARSVWD